MKKKFNRIMSFMCAFITLFNTFLGIFGTTTSYAAMTDDFIESQILLVDKGKCGRFLTYNGSEIQAMYVVYEAEDGKEYPSYCMEPSFQGVGSNDISYGEYVIKGKIDNDRLWRVVTNGYPYKSMTKYDVISEREAFFATKQALYRTLDDEPLNYGSLNSEGDNMIEAIKDLYDIGLNGNGGYIEPQLVITPETNETVVDEFNPQYKSQVFSVEGNCEFDTYEVLFELEDLPQGSMIANENGVNQTTFKANEKFKVMIPVNENEITSFNVEVKANLKSMPVYYAECENVRMQAMLVTANPYEEVKEKVSVKLNKTVANITINKKDSVTEKGLANAVFKVEKVDGTIVGTFTTDNSGKVRVPITEAGYYRIIEELPPERISISRY